MSVPSDSELEKVVKAALAEDVGPIDATSEAVVPPKHQGSVCMVAREPMVLAGAALAVSAFRQIDPELKVDCHSADGMRHEVGGKIMTVSGLTKSILTAERVALNFVQRLSGVATITARFVEAVRNTNAEILDTRKTTPGWRQLEKYAVTCGGGTNHRFGLFDMIMIKDNHLAALKGSGPNPVAAGIRRARRRFPNLKVEVEADNLEQVAQAADAGADIILLDNMSLEELRESVRIVDGRAKTEASGGVNLRSVRGIAETGVDFISVGAITHSVKSIDIGLDFAD